MCRPTTSLKSELVFGFGGASVIPVATLICAASLASITSSARISRTGSRCSASISRTKQARGSIPPQSIRGPKLTDNVERVQTAPLIATCSVSRLRSQITSIAWQSGLVGIRGAGFWRGNIARGPCPVLPKHPVPLKVAHWPMSASCHFSLQLPACRWPQRGKAVAPDASVGGRSWFTSRPSCRRSDQPQGGGERIRSRKSARSAHGAVGRGYGVSQ
jgi:hypothetical protein